MQINVDCPNCFHGNTCKFKKDVDKLLNTNASSETFLVSIKREFIGASQYTTEHYANRHNELTIPDNMSLSLNCQYFYPTPGILIPTLNRPVPL